MVSSFTNSDSHTFTITDVLSGGGHFSCGAPAQTCTLGALATYTGKTHVTAGILQPGLTNAFPITTAFTINSPGVFNMNSFNSSVGSFAGTGSIVITLANVLTTGNDNTATTFSGIVSGSGALTKQGTGNQTLSGINTYTGVTTITQGTLSLGDGLSVGNIILEGNLITNNSELAYNTPSTITHSGNINGTGSFAKYGVGALTITGNNGDFTGVTNIYGGTIISASALAMGNTGAVYIRNGAVLTFTVASSSNKFLSIQPGGTLNMGGFFHPNFRIVNEGGTYNA